MIVRVFRQDLSQEVITLASDHRLFLQTFRRNIMIVIMYHFQLRFRGVTIRYHLGRLHRALNVIHTKDVGSGMATIPTKNEHIKVVIKVVATAQVFQLFKLF